MKRSEVNRAVRDASECFARRGWALPPTPRWDVTDFGMGDFRHIGLVLVNLSEQPEYCEKLVFAYPNQRTPSHTHRQKKEDIVCRTGALELRLWSSAPGTGSPREAFALLVDGQPREHRSGATLLLKAGSRITITPGIYHEFWPTVRDTIIGEVSTANDDLNDNIFTGPVSRFTAITEDEPPSVTLVSDLGRT